MNTNKVNELHMVRTEDAAEYVVSKGVDLHGGEDTVIAAALEILVRRMRKAGDTMSSPETIKTWLRIHLGNAEHECFGCIWLNTQNRYIAHETLFTGTLSQAAVYPREVVKRALHHNAAAVVLYHNHPSGLAEPSRADEVLTNQIKSALAMVDTKTLDHFVVTTLDVTSFAERGLI
jgi:DNA repair protein RadC